MKQFLITIKSDLPYPVKKEFRINGSSMATVAGRAIRKFRKEIGKKKITDMNMSITTVGKVEMPILVSQELVVPEILAH